jgi:ATP-dependent DNA ligase
MEKETMTKEFPTLYRKAIGGAIQYWNIRVEDRPAVEYLAPGVAVPNGKEVGLIISEYGQMGTESPQKTTDVVLEGKNTGKKNETTAVEQAIKEAKSKWEIQKKKKGYVETIEAAEAGEVDDLVEGGIFPMLADKFSTKGDRVMYPAYLQPKLDGYRCIAIVKDGKCTLWSRTRKRINSVPHIERAVEKLVGGANAILDGELYNHDWVIQYGKEKAFEMLGCVRKKEPNDLAKEVSYHIYDMPSAEFSFEDRYRIIAKIFALSESAIDKLVGVETIIVQDEDDAMNAFESYLDKKYEGVMIRTRSGAYFGHPTKRSLDLLKIKEFDDSEFKVVGITEGRGKMAGKAIFVCLADNGNEFEAKMKGPLEKLKEYWENPDKYVGKILTVQYQGFTSAKKVPRFPVALRFREDL